MVIGLAGRPGSGKSAVACTLARREGVEWVDLDQVAWRTYASGTDVHEALVNRFGKTILNEDQTIDRRRLAERVFGDEAARRDLDRIVHPAVARRLREILHSLERGGTRLAIVEGALLASSPHVERSDYDAILWLEAGHETRRRRLQADGREDHATRGNTVHPGPGAILVDAEGTVKEVTERVWTLVQDLQDTA